MEQNNLTNPTMHLFHIPQCTIQNRNVHISVLNGALWDMEQLHCEICELDEFNGILWMVRWGTDYLNKKIFSSTTTGLSIS